ncbi:hypothetical protein RUS47_02915 [Mycoplasmoides gallisepticum]|uniref:Uncharacterized protein n=1 Tax=Mycoplasmoides gallisepticum WI01_2001.043-13-2P TaxID=1159201 RepID=J3YHB5_MYCGL|nr:hypothetical protein [Mycoplasmoides gallisepticum]AFP76098.1 hypothetical protein HFMG94VAA_4102 [Mycoplasmoides gallisepticum VA94_7994-1-7P]AFP76865.1 hypothetical protein HFMG95NCA_4029 [Mycoplasmoides gallisepticum NC95_13295-2-2P]AFP77623.1 hypothetical protein HFMG96NCA_4222 [Mycoplasmoides gallisepticum NC96_1596-4-2P]AFP78390.1 hypothetical protein HFMG01NYA_4092 [Mycoplasmoides gallisepticum NY01_2001.047-5-1P]AFP79150.1 hypothetical protein HFMG01WIA_3953 [Mycoplasmoides gallisep
MLKKLTINQVDHKLVNQIAKLIFNKFNLHKNIIPFLLKHKIEKLFTYWALMKATMVIVDQANKNILIYSDNPDQINKKYQQEYINLMNTFQYVETNDEKSATTSIIHRFKSLLSRYETLMLNQEVATDIKNLNQILLLLSDDQSFLNNAKELIQSEQELFAFSASHLNYLDYENNKMYQIIKIPLMINNMQIKDVNQEDVVIYLYSTKQAVD